MSESIFNHRRLFPAPGQRWILLLLLFLAVIWFDLIHHLGILWSANVQYNYGWAVPVLCLALVGRRAASAVMSPRRAGGGLMFGIVILALLYGPTRLVEMGSPDWRVVSWALALEVVGLTLGLVYLLLGPQWWQRLAFAIVFFLVAVPWPTFVENGLIQGLTRADTTTAMEVLDWLGISALQHGNVIEVATGNVGVNDACSGIRSVQTTLMIALFFGEIYQLKIARRLGLLAGGLALSFVFNLARITFLTWEAARHGLDATAQWHDRAGDLTLAAGCLALWGLAKLMAGKAGKSEPVFPAAGACPAADHFPVPALARPLLLALLGWLAVVEYSVPEWYRWHETRLPPVKSWTIDWPTNNPTFKSSPLPDAQAQMLSCDESHTVAWTAGDIQWLAVFLRWDARRPALVYAHNHTPDVCLTNGGHPTTKVKDQAWLKAGGRMLPFAVYTVAETGRPTYVFYCLWSDRPMGGDRQRTPRHFLEHLAPVLAGVRLPGHHSLEIAVTGLTKESAAEAALQDELGKLVVN